MNPDLIGYGTFSRIRNFSPDPELFPGSGTICFGSGSGENDEQINIFISNFRPLDSIRRDEPKFCEILGLI